MKCQVKRLEAKRSWAEPSLCDRTASPLLSSTCTLFQLANIYILARERRTYSPAFAMGASEIGAARIVRLTVLFIGAARSKGILHSALVAKYAVGVSARLVPRSARFFFIRGVKGYCGMNRNLDTVGRIRRARLNRARENYRKTRGALLISFVCSRSRVLA